jgi:hypothetical protein
VHRRAGRPAFCPIETANNRGNREVNEVKRRLTSGERAAWQVVVGDAVAKTGNTNVRGAQHGASSGSSIPFKPGKSIASRWHGSERLSGQ